MAPTEDRDQHCKHTNIILEPSQHAAKVGYTRPSETQRVAATTPSGRLTQSSTNPRKPGQKQRKSKQDIEETSTWEVPSPGTFPAPLVLPGDSLAIDPRYPAQSLLSFTRSRDRNELTKKRDTIYVVSAFSDGRDRKENTVPWKRDIPQMYEYKQIETTSSPAQPQIADLVDYLAAFYHGMPVKLHEHEVTFSSMRRLKMRTPDVQVDVGTGETHCVRIRTTEYNATFRRQVNLNDMLDAAMDMLPTDAYALLMVTDFDLYEEDEDEFCCGRAYGASRIAIVSTARYNPDLDEVIGIDRSHAWPASHCATFVQSRCRAAKDSQEPASISSKSTATGSRRSNRVQSSAPISSCERTNNKETPLSSAISAFTSTNLHPSNPYLLFLSRVCRTAAHELGHCFGLDHCTYYACSMQGSASLQEDARQPMYLCPVDLEKLTRAIGGSAGTTVKKRYRALLEVCERWEEEGTFKAYGAWIKARLEEMENTADKNETRNSTEFGS